MGGSAETDVIELTVKPQRPNSPLVVTMLTPLTARRMALVKAFITISSSIL
jgi:hypothetical protein